MFTFDKACIRNGNFVLGPLDVQFRAAAVTVVIGPNGGGKSTLLRAAAGLLPAVTGSARFRLPQPLGQLSDVLTTARSQLSLERSASTDQELASVVPAQRARWISFVPQRPESVAGFSVQTSVELGQVSRRPDHARVRQAMRRTGIEALADEFVGHLSEGQRHRVAFARALAQQSEQTHMLIVDEPTSALDPSWTRTLASELRHCAKEGLAVLVATHDFAFAGAIADDVVALSQGKVAACGLARDILTPHILQPIFNVPFRMVEHLAASPLCLPMWGDAINTM